MENENIKCNLSGNGKSKDKKRANASLFKLMSCLLILFGLMTMSSCSDNKLAKKLNGTWATSFENTDVDGRPQSMDIEIAFKYKEKSGGIFREKQILTETITEEGYDIYYSIESNVSGEYEVRDGDVYLSYNVPSLSVELKDFNIKTNFSDDPVQGLMNALDDISMSMSNPFYIKSVQKDIKRSIISDVQENMYDHYVESNKEGNCMPEIKIDKNTLSFKNEEGRITFKKLIKEVDSDNSDKEDKSTSKSELQEKSTSTDKIENRSGSIGKYPITISLESSGSDVAGTYYYNKNPESVFTLKGKVGDDGKMHIKEFTPDGFNSGEFVLDRNYDGVFTNSKGKTFDVKID